MVHARRTQVHVSTIVLHTSLPAGIGQRQQAAETKYAGKEGNDVLLNQLPSSVVCRESMVHAPKSRDGHSRLPELSRLLRLL